MNSFEEYKLSRILFYKYIFLEEIKSWIRFMERRPTNKYLNLATAKERSCLDQPFLKVEFGSTFLKSG